MPFTAEYPILSYDQILAGYCELSIRNNGPYGIDNLFLVTSVHSLSKHDTTFRLSFTYYNFHILKTMTMEKESSFQEE